MVTDTSVRLKSIRTFFVGGESTRLAGLPVEHRSMVLNGVPREVNPNGVHTHGQMYVQQYELSRPKHHIPVLLWHGGGMTGCTWESTPDGRPGWLWRFLEAGYNVYVSDAVERGRSSWAMFPEIYKEAPAFRTKEEGWKVFRLGTTYADSPTDRHVFPGQQFPIGSFDEFAKQWVPRWPAHEHITLAAYQMLVERIGVCVIVGHSQGAGFAVEIARRLPHHVRAVVAVEPGGMPKDLPTVQMPAHMVMWGDHIEAAGQHWIRYRHQAESYIAQAGQLLPARVVDLPREGVIGNSHFPMMDRNSDAIFEKVQTWIAQVSNQPAELTT